MDIGEINKMEDDGISINVLESYRFWKQWASQKDDLLFPMPYHEWLNKYGNECSICEGTPARTWNDGIKRYCVCSLLKLLSHNENEYREIQSPYHQMTLDTLHPLYNPPNESDKELIDTIKVIKTWLVNFNHWFFIWGGRGVAKTHILQSIRTILPKGLCIYITAGDFRSKLFNAQKKDGEVEALFSALSSVPILLFDDWGMEYQKLNDWAGSTFENIIDRRSNFPDYFPTIVTSNKSEFDLKHSSDDSILRTISRLCNPVYSGSIMLSQADFRDDIVQRSIK
jgi:DNA replication protein DnaC